MKKRICALGLGLALLLSLCARAGGVAHVERRRRTEPQGFCGVHAGLLAMAAVEVLNIVPFLSAGSAFKGMLKYFLAAVVAGKSVGALAYFLDGRWMI